MTDHERDGQTPHPTTLDEVRPLAVLPVFSTTAPNLAGLLGASRWTAYSDVRRGRWPSIVVGRRVVVPVPALLRVLGVEQLTAAAH